MGPKYYLSANVAHNGTHLLNSSDSVPETARSALDHITDFGSGNALHPDGVSSVLSATEWDVNLLSSLLLIIATQRRPHRFVLLKDAAGILA
jgi:hypothetical protein